MWLNRIKQHLAKLKTQDEQAARSVKIDNINVRSKTVFCIFRLHSIEELTSNDKTVDSVEAENADMTKFVPMNNEMKGCIITHKFRDELGIKQIEILEQQQQRMIDAMKENAALK